MADSILNIERCVPLGYITNLHVINFQSSSKVFLKFDNPNAFLVGGSILLKKMNGSELQQVPLSSSEGYQSATLETNHQYEVYSYDSCGDLYLVTSFDTKVGRNEDMIAVSPSLWNVIESWKLGDPTESLFDALSASENVSKPEMIEFIQKFAMKGAPIPDVYSSLNTTIPQNVFEIAGPFIVGPPVGPPGGPTGGDDGDDTSSDCLCRVLNVTLNDDDISPTNSGPLDKNLLPRYITEENMIIRDDPGDIKIWHAGAFIGPARYLQLWGDTDGCYNTLFNESWGGADDNTSMATEGYAKIEITALCLDGEWRRSDCDCEHTISYRYRYNSMLNVQAVTDDAWCGFGDKRAQAVAEDYATFSAVRIDQLANGFDREVIELNMDVEHAVVSCNTDFDETKIIDAVKLGFTAYLYSKGFTINFPESGNLAGTDLEAIINQVGNEVYEEYQKSNMFSLAESLVSESWYIVNSCEDPYGPYNTQGNPPSADTGPAAALEGDSIVSLNGHEKIVLRLKVGSHLDVKGRADWRADARVLSGFSLSVVLARNENVDGAELDYCCNDPAATFVSESLHHIFQSNDYTNTISTHLDPYFNAYMSETELDQLIGPYDRNFIHVDDPFQSCDNLVNGRSNEGFYDGEMVEADNDLNIYFDGEQIIVKNAKCSSGCQVKVLSVDGRMHQSEQFTNNSELYLPLFMTNIVPGIYIVNVVESDGTLSNEKIFLR
jgi:hypothetical protein